MWCGDKSVRGETSDGRVNEGELRMQSSPQDSLGVAGGSVSTAQGPMQRASLLLACLWPPKLAGSEDVGALFILEERQECSLQNSSHRLL